MRLLGLTVPHTNLGGGGGFTDDGVGPGVPQGIWFRPDGSGQMKLSWLGNSEGDLSHYEYRYGTVNPPTSDPVVVSPTLLLPGTESTAVAGTSDGTTYYAQVRAVDLAGNEGDWSAVQTAVGSVLGFVQSAHGISGPDGTTATAILPAVPTDGNLLVAFVASNQTAGASIPAPSGWSSIGSVGTNNDRCAAFYKVASGDSATVQSIGLTSGPWGIIVVEVKGQDASPIDVSMFEQSRDLGATSATAQADELALAFWWAAALTLGSKTPSAGWARVEYPFSGLGVAKFLSATGAQSMTVTLGTGTNNGAGCIVTVKA